MGANVTSIPGADKVQIYFRNYTYATAVLDLPNLSLALLTDQSRLAYNFSGTIHKLAEEHNPAASFVEDRIIISDANGLLEDALVKINATGDMEFPDNGYIKSQTSDMMQLKASELSILPDLSIAGVASTDKMVRADGSGYIVHALIGVNSTGDMELPDNAFIGSQSNSSMIQLKAAELSINETVNFNSESLTAINDVGCTTVTASGEVEGGSLDINGNADISGTLDSHGAAHLYSTLQIDTVADASADVDKFAVIDGADILDYRTGAELLSDLSGDAAGAFDWNDQNLTSVGDITCDDVNIVSDSYALRLGAGTDMSVNYDGTDGNIDTSLVAPSDLEITCGANKTIELQNVVYDDLQFPVVSGALPGANIPTKEAITTNHDEYSFDVDDYMDLPTNELPHWYKESTNGTPHLHLTIRDAQSAGADRFAKFTIYISLLKYGTGNTWSETSLTAELTIPDGSSAKQGFTLSMGSLDLSTGTYVIGSQVGIRVKRIAATGGTEYGANVFVTQCGIHLQKDTMGSRQETTK